LHAPSVRIERFAIGSGVGAAIDFLSLMEDEGCNRFHEMKRTVRTLSYDQVNRPLYASSVNRWQQYEKFLKAVDWPKYG
jgi:hypothetical protein